MTRMPLTEAERAAVSATLAAYEAIAADLRAVLADGWPSAAELADAPLLDDWTQGERPTPCLDGTVSGTWTMTAPTVAVSETAAVLRTTGGWYRLGYRLRDGVDIVPTCELR